MGLVPGYLPSYQPVAEFIELFAADEKPLLPQVDLTPEEYCQSFSYGGNIEESIHFVQVKLREQQQVGIVAGRCLRLYARNFPPVALSRMACQMVQMLDLNYFAAWMTHGISSLCLKAQWSMTCFNQSKAAENVFREDLQPAEALFEKGIGIKNLLNRPFKIPEESWCTIL